jgi:hypothetical protein
MQRMVSVFTCFGNFQGGHLIHPELGIKIPYEPGDILLVRTYALEHFLEDFCGEYRFGMVHTLHQSLIDDKYLNKGKNF